VGNDRGATLIEALITLLVMSIGLLGMAALQLIGIQENTSAFRHSQATWFAYGMADRMRANLDLLADREDVADHYDGINVDMNSMPNGTICGAGSNCSVADMARFDADEWREQVMTLPGGQGTVEEDATGGRYLIRVMWDDDTRTNVDTEGCPSDDTIAKTCVEIMVEP
jgi:type IV pilus assembly protein PilV